MDTISYLLAVAVVVGLADSTDKRAAGTTEPCFVVATGGPVSPANFVETITDLKLRAQTLQTMSLDIKTWLKTPSTPGTNPLVSLSFVNNMYMDTVHFTSDISLNGSVSDAASNTITELQTHFKLLMEIAMYIADIRKSDKLANDVSMGVLVSKIKSIENRVLSAACSVQIALRAKASDVTTFKSTLAERYLSTTEPVWRLYIVMNDSARLSHPYLTSVYELILAATSNATK